MTIIGLQSYAGTMSTPLILQALILVAALTMDTLVVCFSLSAGKIRIPYRGAFIITVMSTLVLGIGLYGGKELAVYVPQIYAKAACYSFLTGMGIYKIICGIREKKETVPKTFSAQHTKELKTFDAVALGVVLSSDSFAAGIGIGAVSSEIWWYCSFSLIIGMAFNYLGQFLGKQLSEKNNLNFSVLTGGALILVGITGFF